MAEQELTSGVASPAPSTEQAPVTSPTPQQPEVAAPAPADKPVNLFEIPEFKQYQRQQNQTISQLQRQQQEAERRYQQQLAQLETRDMDEPDRRAYQMQQELQTLRQERENSLAYAQQMQAEMQKNNILNRISRKTGVPVEELQGYTDADDAWEYANDKALEREKKALAAQQREQRQAAAGSVDLGGGASITALSEWEAQVEAAYNRGDATAYTRLLRQRPT